MNSSTTSENTKSSCDSCPSSTPQRSDAIEGGLYKEFSREFQGPLAAQRIPMNGSLEITENCNFRCIHCYQGMNKHKQMLKLEQWQKIMDDIAEEGCLWLLLTGGEPLLHPDFMDIYEYAIRKGFMVTLFTNARLIKPKHIELFRRLPPFGIEVTLYGMSEDMYRKTTGTKNSFSKVIENVKAMKAAKLPIKLKSVAFKPLANDLPAIRQFAEQEMQVDFKFDTKIDPSIYGDQLHHIRLSPEETMDLEDNEIGAQGIKQDLNLFLNRNQWVAKSETIYNCGAGKSSFYIDYKGSLHTCSSDRLEQENFDLTQKSFKHIWQNELPKIIFAKKRQQNAICNSCEYRGMCDVCPATAKLATGSKEGRPMYICQHTMARKNRFLQTQGLQTQENTHV